MAFKRFLRRNLEASESGSETQQNDMAGLVSEGQKLMGELSDQLSGERSLKNHRHHKPKHLTEVVVDNIEDIVKLRREIERG